jgi:hypothetical protein
MTFGMIVAPKQEPTHERSGIRKVNGRDSAREAPGAVDDE